MLECHTIKSTLRHDDVWDGDRDRDGDRDGDGSQIKDLARIQDTLGIEVAFNAPHQLDLELGPA